MKILMVGVSPSTKGGMWTVVNNYIGNSLYESEVLMKYIPTSRTGSIPVRIMYTFFRLIQCFVYILFNNVDVVHIHMAERGSVYRKNMIINLSRIKKSKILIHMHGAEFEQWFANLSDEKKKKVQSILNKADGIIILGNYMRDFIEKITRRPKIFVVYNSVDVIEGRYNALSTEILFLAEISRRKGVIELLDSIKILLERGHKNFCLHLYGPLRDREIDISKEINSRKIQDYVIYEGWLDSDKKPEVFEKMGINVLPSYNEGLPMTILETMSFGIPTISTRVAAIPEVVKNKVNGVIIEPGDSLELANAIESVLFDEKKKREMSNSCKEIFTAELNINAHIKEILKIYGEI